MKLCIHIDTNTGFQFDDEAVIPDGDLFDPAPHQRFFRFTDGAGKELLLLGKQLGIAWIQFQELLDILKLTLCILDF